MLESNESTSLGSDRDSSSERESSLDAVVDEVEMSLLAPSSSFPLGSSSSASMDCDVLAGDEASPPAWL